MFLRNQKDLLPLVIFFVSTFNYCNSEISKRDNEKQNSCQGEKDNGDCLKKVPDSISEYSFLGIVSKWEDGEISEIQDWIHKQSLKKFFSPCSSKTNENIERLNGDSPVVVIERLYNCPNDGKYTRYNGKMDSNMLPKGKGTFEVVSGSNPSIKTGQPCYTLMAGVQGVQAKFKAGVANGLGQITYNDGCRLEGEFKEGVISGVAKLFAPMMYGTNLLHLIGYFIGGRLHGPAWILVPANSLVTSTEEIGAILVHFENGKVNEEKPVIYVPQSGNQAYQGKLTDGYIIDDPIAYEIRRLTKWQCIHIVKEASNPLNERKIEPLRLPIKIIADPENGRIQIKNSQVIFFNPIARTGTETFMWILHELKQQSEGEFDLQMPSRSGNDRRNPPPKLILKDSYKNIQAVVDQISSQNKKPLLYAKPYNFIEFSEHGSLWTPDYFSIVRDPIEKVASWYYYKRSALHIVENKLNYPNEPLPKPEKLKKNFNNCVLDEDEECSFYSEEDSISRGDHRGQMMAFCGHEDWCSEFNSERVFQKAKENIEKYYPIVGVLEEMNKTLDVLEDRFPTFFKGASEIYTEYGTTSEYEQVVSQAKFGENQFKVPITKEVMDKVKPSFSIEYEFYEYCKQRLDAQYKALSKKP